MGFSLNEGAVARVCFDSFPNRSLRLAASAARLSSRVRALLNAPRSV